MQERELIAYTTNAHGDTIVLWCSTTEEGACTLAVWESQRWLNWETDDGKRMKVSPRRYNDGDVPRRA